MSRAHTPNTPRANNNTTTTHLTTTTNDVPSPRQAAVSGPLSPSATHPDLPRRSRSSSPGALNEKADADDVSIQHRDDGPANESHIGDRLSGQGQEEEEDGGVDGEGKKKEKKESMEDAKERVEEFDWEGLEGRFWDRMDECRRVEEGLREDFEEVIKVFNAWASAGSVGEEDRAAKRLRTRMTFVQQREETLEEKRLHYLKVVQAFESALALLSAT